MKRIRGMLAALSVASMLLAAAGGVGAQRTQSVGDKQTTTTNTGQILTATPPPAPATVPAKYEGGVVGYGKAEGTLNFDDANRRLLFRDKAQREVFSMPYDVIMAITADTRARRSTAGTVIASTVPYGLGLPALLLKSKTRYLTVHYSDPDTHAQGITSFKLNSEQTLASVLYTLGNKAGLTQRGDAFVRRRDEGPSPMSPDGATVAVPVPMPAPVPAKTPEKPSSPPQ
jgi:hypothetical protein